MDESLCLLGIQQIFWWHGSLVLFFAVPTPFDGILLMFNISKHHPNIPRNKKIIMRLQSISMKLQNCVNVYCMQILFLISMIAFYQYLIDNSISH